MRPLDDNQLHRICELISRLRVLPAEARAASMKALPDCEASVASPAAIAELFVAYPVLADVLRKLIEEAEIACKFREWALQQDTEEELVAEILDVRQNGGRPLSELIDEFEQGLHDRESINS